jgi:polyphenol oxidase
MITLDTLARPGIAHGFFTREGGVSEGFYASLNCGFGSGDAPENVAENRARAMGGLDVAPDALVTCYQVHSPTVVEVEAPWRREEAPRADAMVTTRRGLALGILTADCAPVLFADAEAGVIGACHCGRPGVVAGIVPATLAAMRDLGASAITAWVGPHVCGRCYEVPQQMQDDVAAVEPATRATTSWRTPSLDVGAGVAAQLEREGVEIVDVSRCTIESPDLFSYRREGKRSGRQAGIIRRMA